MTQTPTHLTPEAIQTILESLRQSANIARQHGQSATRYNEAIAAFYGVA